MLMLTLVAMGQFAASEPEVDPAPPQRGRMAWVIVTPMAAGMAGGVAAIHSYNAATGIHSDPGTALFTMMIGAAAGAGLGLLAGWFAREGDYRGQVTSVLLWIAGVAAAGFQTYEIATFKGAGYGGVNSCPDCLL
jgi:hypothetical protein